MDYYPIWSYHIQNYQSLPANLTQVTQKLILSNNIDGKGIRILLSHYYSNHDITFYDMSIKINTKTYPLTIHNQNRITLHPQDSIYTDTLPLNINTKDDIEIIMAIDSQGPINGYVGLNSQQMITIEHSSQINCSVLKKDFNKYVYFGIEAIEIQTDVKPFVIGVFGDSLVHQGYWMNALYKRIYQKYDNVVIYNEGISGNRLLKDASSTSSLSTIFGQAGISRFKNDMYKKYQPNLILFALGINDLVHPGNGSPLKELPTIEDMINGYKSIINNHLYLCTI
ncbi:MAG: SGNH/GDSL hydrolase family protein, partial [Coprobacillus sp.]